MNVPVQCMKLVQALAAQELGVLVARSWMLAVQSQTPEFRSLPRPWGPIVTFAW
jgi:hypothetical protein